MDIEEANRESRVAWTELIREKGDLGRIYHLEALLARYRILEVHPDQVKARTEEIRARLGEILRLGDKRKLAQDYKTRSLVLALFGPAGIERLEA
jgi:hypothetical protein